MWGIFSFSLHGQEEEEKGFLEKNFFHAYHLTSLLDYFVSPAKKLEVENAYQKETELFYTQTYASLVSVTYEPRLNLYNYNDFFSLSIGMPASIAFSAVGDQDDAEGVSHLQFPLLLQANFFNFSTYDNIDEWGFSLGGGPILTYAPLFYDKSDFNPENERSFVMMVGKINVIKQREENNLIFGLRTGFNPKMVEYGKADSPQQKLTNFMFKFTWGYSIGY